MQNIQPDLNSVSEIKVNGTENSTNEFKKKKTKLMSQKKKKKEKKRKEDGGESHSQISLGITFPVDTNFSKNRSISFDNTELKFDSTDSSSQKIETKYRSDSIVSSPDIIENRKQKKKIKKEKKEFIIVGPSLSNPIEQEKKEEISIIPSTPRIPLLSKSSLLLSKSSPNLKLKIPPICLNNINSELENEPKSMIQTRINSVSLPSLDRVFKESEQNSNSELEIFVDILVPG